MHFTARSMWDVFVFNQLFSCFQMLLIHWQQRRKMKVIEGLNLIQLFRWLQRCLREISVGQLYLISSIVLLTLTAPSSSTQSLFIYFTLMRVEPQPGAKNSTIKSHFIFIFGGFFASQLKREPSEMLDTDNITNISYKDKSDEFK